MNPSAAFALFSNWRNWKRRFLESPKLNNKNQYDMFCIKFHNNTTGL